MSLATPCVSYFCQMTVAMVVCMRPNACPFLFQTAFAVLYVARSAADTFAGGVVGFTSKSYVGLGGGVRISPLTASQQLKIQNAACNLGAYSPQLGPLSVGMFIFLRSILCQFCLCG